MSEQHGRHPQLPTFGQPLLNVIEVLGEAVNVAAPTTTFAETPVVEGGNVVAALGEKRPDVLIPAGVFPDAVDQKHGRRRILDLPATPELFGPISGRPRLDRLSYICHSPEGSHNREDGPHWYWSMPACCKIETPRRSVCPAIKLCKLDPMARMWPLLVVAIGGAIGTLARWGLVSLAGPDRHTVAILGLNVVGSLILGLALGHRERLDDDRFNLIGTGFAGGLTTFSTYAVSVAQKLEDGDLLAAAGNGFGTVIAAFVAAGVAFRLARLSGSRRIRRLERARRTAGR